MTWPEIALILTGARRDLARAFAHAEDNEVRSLLLTALDALDDVQDCVKRKDVEGRRGGT